MNRFRRIVVIAAAASTLGLVSSSVSSAANPRPNALAAADRTCGATANAQTTSATFDVVASCTIDVFVPGTVYITSTGQVGLTTNSGSAQAEFQVGVDGGLLVQSRRVIDAAADTGTGHDGTDRALVTQAAAQITGSGKHDVAVSWRRTTGPSALEATNVSINAIFIPDATDERACESAPLASKALSAGDSGPLVSCDVTVSAETDLIITASTGANFPSTSPSAAQVFIDVDGVSTGVALTPSSASGEVASANISDSAIWTVTVSAGAHQVELRVGAGTVSGNLVLVQPAVRAIAVATDSLDSAATIKGGVTRTVATSDVGSTSFQQLLVFYMPPADRPAVYHLLGSADLYRNYVVADNQLDVQIVVDGVPLPQTTRTFDIFTGASGFLRNVVVEATVSLGPGQHSAYMAARRVYDSSNGVSLFRIQMSTEMVQDASVVDPPPTTGGGGGGGGVATDYVPVVPDRVLETRVAGQTGYVGGQPQAGQVVQLDVTGVGTSRVPDNAVAVVLNVTGTNAAAPGFVTVWPCGAPQPTASNLNLAPGVSSPNLVVSKIGDGGTVCLFTQSAADLVVDVNGYMPAGSQYTPLVPERLLETRGPNQAGYAGGKPVAGAVIQLQVTGAGASNVPANASAVVLNVTGTGAATDGYVTVWPCGAAQPTASNLNLAAGSTSPNLVVAKIGDGGRVCLFTQSSADLIADVNGYVPAGSSYLAVVPQRLLETRPPNQAGYSGAKPGAGATIELQIPQTANAVLLNVTGVGADAPGYVTVWPCGSPQPNASNLNLSAGGISPNLVMAKVGAGGKVCIFTQSGADLIADVNGYWP